MIANASAAILAGGAGTRLGGVSKALLEIGGRTILARQLDVLRPLFGEVFLVAPDPSPFDAHGVRVVRDRLAGKGAPGGVHAALEEAGAGWVFCLACDMPFVSAPPVALLAARREGAEAVVFLRAGFVEPLFGFYATSLLPAFRLALETGDPSLAKLLSAARTVRVAERDLAEIDPGCRSLSNVNTPEELARARGR